MGILNHRSNGWYISLPPSRVKIACLLSLFVLINAAAPQSVVKSLPGYPGTTLPFHLETGYVTVGEKEDVELFYYFVESERDPEWDPLMLWLTGGPGCSVFCGLAFENIGPFTFDPEGCEGGRLPTLHSNPYSWTKVASIIFLDAPVGTGFSYATTSEAYHSSDTNTTEDVSLFVRKWLLEHPRFIKNRLYIGGDSYAGKLVPMITLKISQGIDAGLNPKVHLQGFVIGNPLTDKRIDMNSRVPFAHRLALLSDEYYEMAKVNCGGEYVNPDPTNVWCLYALKFFEENFDLIVSAPQIYTYHMFWNPSALNWDRMASDFWTTTTTMNIPSLAPFLTSGGAGVTFLCCPANGPMILMSRKHCTSEMEQSRSGKDAIAAYHMTRMKEVLSLTISF